MTVHELFGLLVYNLCYKLYYGVHKARNGYGIRFHIVEPICVEWAVHGQPTALLFRIVINSPGWLELDKNRPCVVCLNF